MAPAGEPEPGARVVLSWSGGKDAAYALYELQQQAALRVEELLTTVSADTDRVSVHGVRRSLLDAQADAVGLPVRVVSLPDPCPDDVYEARMGAVTTDYVRRGVDLVAFADRFLSDVREYRTERLDGTGLVGCWPLWGRDTAELAAAFLDAGFEATVVAVDGDALAESFAGRPYDESFLAALPDGVDPCGERGEFHTFVHDGPVFDEPLDVDVGETTTRHRGEGVFHYADLRSATG